MNVLRVAALPGPRIRLYAIHDSNGTLMYIRRANMIRLFAEVLNARVEVLPVNGVGNLQPDGNWTGMIGLVMRSEADVALPPLTLTEERFHSMNFSYPISFSDVTFMTDKPEYISKNSAIFYPFSLSMWFYLLALLIFVAFFFYILKNKAVEYSRILLDVAGNILQQPISFEIGAIKIKLFAVTWLLGVFIISNGYKAVLLSVLSAPLTFGIRDISDLAKASTQQAVSCFVIGGSHLPTTLFNSDIDSWKAIGACLKRNEKLIENRELDFYSTTSKKAYIGGRNPMKADEKSYFISDDSFYHEMYAVPYSRNFCCPSVLNKMAHRILAAGLIQKLQREEDFFWQLSRPTFESVSPSSTSAINIDEISGACIILLCGWILAFITFLLEIFIQKYVTNRSR